MIEVFLTDNQQRIINNRISNGVRLYNEEKERQRKNLYEPYKKMRTEHDLTAYVLSQFSPDMDAIEGFSQRDVTYGLDMMLPELVSNNSIIQIYNEGSRFTNELIKERCLEYNSSIQNRPYFIIISFCVNKEKFLKNINAIFYDSNKSLIRKESIYTRPNLNLRVG